MFWSTSKHVEKSIEPETIIPPENALKTQDSQLDIPVRRNEYDHYIQKAKSIWKETVASPGLSPYPMWANATLIALSTLKSKNRTGLLQRPILVGFSAIYAGVGYVLSYDDTHGPQLGAGWGSIYLMLCTPAAIRSRQWLPITMATSIATTTYFYAQEALD